MSNPATAAILFLSPILVAALFWLLAWRERRMAGPTLVRPSFVQRNGPLVATYLLVAVAFWALFLIVWPMLYMVDYSFHRKLPPSRRGGPDDVYTLENYWYFVYGSTRVFTSYNWVHINAFWQTIAVSVVVTLANFAICYPLAYYMAQVARPGRLRVLLLLLIVPYWVNEILRAFAFMVLFGT
ncbi:MAG: ABC transporter permease, partial [Rhodospirillales bacterium]